MLKSRVLGEIIQELNLKELRVTSMVISANKETEHSTEKYAIPELEQYIQGTRLNKITSKEKRIHLLPLIEATSKQERMLKVPVFSKNGIDIKYVNDTLTNPPYNFPYVLVEELEAIILNTKITTQPNQKPVIVPEAIKFKRVEITQPALKQTIKATGRQGGTYTLQSDKISNKIEVVDAIRKLIATEDPIKFCKMVLQENLVAQCEELLKKQN